MNAGVERLAERLERALVPVRRAPLSVRSALLRFLYDVYPEAVTMEQVRSHLASTYDWEGHQKTPGMTLERLKKEGLVVHEGTRLWSAAGPIEPESLPTHITIERADAEAILSALRSFRGEVL